MEEIWRDVKDFEGLYQISNRGRIKSMSYNHSGKEGILKPKTDKTGYLMVSLSKDKKMKTFLLHRIVTEAFPEICGELFEGCEVDHIDTNRENNNANNLRCVTPKENSNNPLTKKHKSEALKGHKLSEETKRKISEVHKGKKPWNKGKTNIYSEDTKMKMSAAKKGKFNTKCSKMVLQLDETTNEVIAEWLSTQEVQRQLGFNQSHISQCCTGKRKTCGGFRWQYKT